MKSGDKIFYDSKPGIFVEMRNEMAKIILMESGNVPGINVVDPSELTIREKGEIIPLQKAFEIVKRMSAKGVK